MTSSDARLVAAAQAGDREALDAVVEAHLGTVYATVRAAMGNGPDVDDVVQETMLRAVRHLHTLHEPAAFRAWIRAIAAQQVTERARQRNRIRTLAPANLDNVGEVPDPDAPFADAADLRVDVARSRGELLRATEWLSPSDHRVLQVWWRELSGEVTRAEAADSLSVSPPHLAVRIQRMRERLRLALRLGRAWSTTPRCTGLTAAAARWDERPDPSWLRRLGRHVNTCEHCAVTDRVHVRDLVVALSPLYGHSLAIPSGASATGPVGATGADALRRVVEWLTSKTGLTVAAGAAAVTTAVAVTVTVTTVGVAPPRAVTTPPQAVAPAVSSATTAAASAPSPRILTNVDPAGVSLADFYIAPDGDDHNPGTIDRPFASINAATALAGPGQVIALRGGVYRPAEDATLTTSGRPDARIVLSNYRGEQPILDGADLADGPLIDQRASYWIVQGLQIRNSPRFGYICRSCGHTVLRRLSIHDNGDTGLILLGPGTVANTVADADFFRNHDTVDNGGSADGLSLRNGTGRGNVVRNCRVFENSGDGLDLSGFADPVTITSLWAYGNGVNRWNIPSFTGPGNGIKLGGGSPAPAVAHVISLSAAWDNAGYGFTEAGNRGRLELTRNTAYRNGEEGFAFVFSAAVLRANVALAGEPGHEVWLGDAVDGAGNSWDQGGWSEADVLSVDPAVAQGPRNADWSLPATDFLRSRRNPGMGAPMEPAPPRP